MSRQERFEAAYAEAHDMPIETFAQYRMGDTYRLPGIAKCWRFWNLALDSVQPLDQRQVTQSDRTIGYTGCIICGAFTDHGGLQCPKLRAYSTSSIAGIGVRP